MFMRTTSTHFATCGTGLNPISKQNPKNLAAVSRVHWGSKFLRKSFRVALYKWLGLSMLRVMADEIHIAYLRIQARKR